MEEKHETMHGAGKFIFLFSLCAIERFPTVATLSSISTAAAPSPLTAACSIKNYFRTRAGSFTVKTAFNEQHFNLALTHFSRLFLAFTKFSTMVKQGPRPLVICGPSGELPPSLSSSLVSLDHLASKITLLLSRHTNL